MIYILSIVNRASTNYKLTIVGTEISVLISIFSLSPYGLLIMDHKVYNLVLYSYYNQFQN